MTPEWQPISTAPEGEPHVRGMWVFTWKGDRRVPSYFCADAGYVNEDGIFVHMNGDDDHGWSADDYDVWAPLPTIPDRPEITA